MADDKHRFQIVAGGKTRRDPNEGRNDPMVPEHWQLGENIQEIIRTSGYETESVEGIAVDIHDLLQAADRVRTELGPKLSALDCTQGEDLRKYMRELAFELDHIRWHCDAAIDFLDGAARQLEHCEGD